MSKVIAPFLFIAIATGLFFSYTKPAYESLQQLTALEAKLIQTEKDANDLQEKQERLWKTYISMDFTRLEAILPNAIDAVRLIIEVDSIALQHDIKINKFQVPVGQATSPVASARGVSTASAGLGTANFSLDCEGLYANIKSFLFDIESNLSLMDVVSLRMSEPGGEEDDGEDTETQDFTVSLNTYWLR